MLANAMKFNVLFFFQAEDGIRDLTVTGVQTCALPISRVPVQRQSDKYWKFGQEQLQALVDDLRAPGAAAQRVLQSLSSDTYFADDHALERLITDEERSNFDAGDVEQWAAETLTDKILLRKEKLFAAMVTDTAQVTQNTALSGTSQWSDYTNSKPTEDLQAGQETIAKNAGVRANTLILGFPVFSKLRNHPKIVERVQNIRVRSEEHRLNSSHSQISYAVFCLKKNT